MMETIQLSPGITLRCFRDTRFKQSCLSLQFIRPMDKREAALNALLPAVLLRGTAKTPDLRTITLRLDDLYGASVNALVRRVGDYQTTGLHFGFIEDKYALEGDEIFAPVVDFLEELLFRPLLQDGVFSADFVESEKKNLIATLEAERNDKRSYASAQLMRYMCKEDSFGIPRLGDKESVGEITPQSLYAHYEKILRESPVELFYVGSNEPQKVAECLSRLFATWERALSQLPPQTAFTGAQGGCIEQQMEVSQGKLAIGYTTPVTLRTEQFAPMQVCNVILGGGMTSKLFSVVREQMSLCYDIGSGYHGSKGILVVTAGIDCHMRQTVEEEIARQIGALCEGKITDAELKNAQNALCNALRGTHDTPLAIESYYATGALSGMGMTPEEYCKAVEQVTKEQVAEVARTLQKHTVFFLKGVQE